MIKSAQISDCGKYRFILTRIWDDTKRAAVFIMLNPSTADGKEDDPTIRRCINFAKSWNCGSINVVNLFDLRTSSPEEMKKAEAPISRDNNFIVYMTVRKAVMLNALIICAWGNHGCYLGQDKKILDLINQAGGDPMALKVSKAGQPCHPLYLKADSMPVPYTGEV